MQQLKDVQEPKRFVEISKMYESKESIKTYLYKEMKNEIERFKNANHSKIFGSFEHTNKSVNDADTPL